MSENSNPFLNPIRLMMDCHRRIERFFEDVLRLARERQGGCLDETERAALDTALRYLRQAPAIHTADEEVSLFPRLRGAGGPDAQAALEQMERLERDHQDVAAPHTTLDRLGRLWLEAGRLEPDAAAALANVAGALRAAYAQHIALEDGVLFPLAERLLPEEDMREMAREIAARRGASLEGDGATSRCAARRADRLAAMA